MSKPIKKLVAVERFAEKPALVRYPAGYKRIFLIDPETGKMYEPILGWEVTDDDLGASFREVDNNSIIVNKS